MKRKPQEDFSLLFCLVNVNIKKSKALYLNRDLICWLALCFTALLFSYTLSVQF